MLFRSRAAALLALTLLAFLTAPVAAQEASPVSAGVALSPDAEVGGLGLAEWSARSWQWFFSFPEPVNPMFDDTGERCSYGQSGAVFFLVAAESSVARSCTVPLGVTIFVPLVGSECSTVEPPPFFGSNEAELAACAVDAVNHVPAAGIADQELSVDGQTVGDLTPYRATSPLFELNLPASNLLGVEPGVAHSVADGFQVLLTPLAEGEHDVVVSVPGPDGLVVTTYRLTVAAPTMA